MDSFLSCPDLYYRLMLVIFKVKNITEASQ